MNTPSVSKSSTRNIATFSFVTPAPEPGSMRNGRQSMALPGLHRPMDPGSRGSAALPSPKRSRFGFAQAGGAAVRDIFSRPCRALWSENVKHQNKKMKIARQDRHWAWRSGSIVWPAAAASSGHSRRSLGHLTRRLRWMTGDHGAASKVTAERRPEKLPDRFNPRRFPRYQGKNLEKGTLDRVSPHGET